MRKTKRKSKFWTLLLMIGVIVIAFKSNITLTGQSLFGKIDGDKAGSVPVSTTFDSADFISSDNLHSSNAILVRLDNQKVLLEKNSKQKVFPASLTKIMTAIVAIEKLPDLKKSIVLPNSMFRELYKADASMAGFTANERVRAIDLLYGVMLPSGGECCIGLAEHIAGSEKEFVEIMNQKAAELGMRNTHFTNTTGLHDDKHYTTVKDLSILLSYALKNNTFKKVFTASHYSTPPTNVHSGGITFDSTLFKNLENPAIDGGRILGGKTGYTNEAGLCLASLAQKDGREYILVTAGAKGNHESAQYAIEDAYTVYDKFFKHT